MKRQGLSLRSIAASVGCAHTTLWYELRRGTPQKIGDRFRKWAEDIGPFTSRVITAILSSQIESNPIEAASDS
ncbi:helix-turn-helix domain-containing protein [Pectinatus frisingensis]|nr:helix-turn-helix domain-containing protein [Pectinatus frisingensis]